MHIITYNDCSVMLLRRLLRDCFPEIDISFSRSFDIVFYYDLA